MNTKILLVTASTLLIASCSMFSDDEVAVTAKQPYAHPDFSVPKPSPYQKANSTAKRVQHIFAFKFDSSEFPDKATRNIQPHVDYLISNPTTKVSIQGATDNVGGKHYNYVLGEQRAKKIAALMVELGVDRSQLVITSTGEARSLYVSSRSVVLAY